MPENEYKYLDHAGLTRFKGKIQDVLDTKVDKENGKYIVTVDSALSSTSTNPVQNKVIAGKLGSTDISSIGDGTVTGAIDDLKTNRNLVVGDDFINIPDNTTSFSLFDTLIESLGSFQGKTFEVQVGANVDLGGVLVYGGRKYCQAIRHSSTNYAAITMFGWGAEIADIYYFTKIDGTWKASKLPNRTEFNRLSTDRNIVLNDNNTVITLADNTTSFTVFDTLINSLDQLQGKTFEVQVGSSVVLDGITIGSGRKFAQILRHSSTNYAVIHMFGWANEGDQYRIMKYNGTWSCVKLPSRSEITKLNTEKISVRATGATLLTSGQNLNSLGVGNYYTNSSALTSSLVNAPAGLTTAIRLISMDIGYGSISFGVQIIVTNAGMYFRRTSDNSGSTWSNWTKFADPAIGYDQFANKYNVTWGTSLTFTIPAGHHAIVAFGYGMAILISNTTTSINYSAIFGNASGITVTRNATTVSQVTVSISSNASISAFVS